MHKKLMALAVAGALAAPAAALAQTTIYGKFNAEYGFAEQPANAANAPRVNAEGWNSGASYVGFRGEEKIGTIAAWYQCESQANMFATNTSGAPWCNRNSALGLKGGFGNFFVGNWDSPMKRSSGVTRITNETGWLGTQFMILDPGGGWTTDFSNRNQQSINYDTPNLGGFSATIQYVNPQATLNGLDSAVNKGVTYGLSAQFATGPFAILGAYSSADKNVATGGLASSEDTGYLIGGTLTFGPVKVGLTYTSLETQPSATTTLDRTAWNLGVNWRIGAGNIVFGYAQADDLEGTAASAAADSGAQFYQIAYVHNLSKRTLVSVGYGSLENDSRGTYNLGGLSQGASNVFPGDSASVFTVSLAHNF